MCREKHKREGENDMIDVNAMYDELMGDKGDEAVDPALNDMIKLLYETGKRWQEEHGMEEDCDIEVMKGKNGELMVKVTPKEEVRG